MCDKKTALAAVEWSDLQSKGQEDRTLYKACMADTLLRMLRQEDLGFEASLNTIGRLYLKNNKQIFLIRKQFFKGFLKTNKQYSCE